MEAIRMLEQEDTLTTWQAANLCRTTRQTVGRWITSGLPLAGGRVVKLAAVRVGRHWLTSRQSLDRFLAASAEPPPPPPTTVPVRVSGRTAKRLRELGIKS